MRQESIQPFLRRQTHKSAISAGNTTAPALTVPRINENSPITVTAAERIARIFHSLMTQHPFANGYALKILSRIMAAPANAMPPMHRAVIFSLKNTRDISSERISPPPWQTG